MKIADLVNELSLSVISGKDGLENKVTGCYVSDLLSDVMGNASEGNIWVTLQTHKNIMAVASLKDIAAVVLVNNNKAADDTIEVSNKENIPILVTSSDNFRITGRIYNLLKTHGIIQG